MIHSASCPSKGFQAAAHRQAVPGLQPENYQFVDIRRSGWLFIDVIPAVFGRFSTGCRRTCASARLVLMSNRPIHYKSDGERGTERKSRPHVTLKRSVWQGRQ